jgi:hypothetical protein
LNPFAPRTEYKNTWLWNLLIESIPPYLVQLSENVILLRRSKEAADQDRKERGIEFDDYLETIEHDVYDDDEEANIGIDFDTLHLTENNLLQAALAFPGISDNGISSLRTLLNPPLLGPRLYTSTIVKTWAKELRAYKDQEPSSCTVSNVPTPEDPLMALIPVLGYTTESIPSLPVLQASFQDDPTIENLDLKLVEFQGMHKSCYGEGLLDGLSREGARTYHQSMVITPM